MCSNHPSVERRRESRLFVEVPGSYEDAEGRRCEMVFAEISAHGCRLDQVEQRVAVGDVLTLNLGPIGPLRANVRWHAGDRAGVEFHEPLEHAVVEYFAAFCGAAS